MQGDSLLKVLLVAPHGGIPGGISRWTGHLMRYYNAFGKHDCQLDIVSIGRTRFINIKSNPIYRLWTGIKDYRGIFKNFKKAFKGKKYDVMHLTSSASWSLVKDIYMLRYAKKKGSKTVIHFRFGRIPDLFVQKNWEYKLLIKVLKLADKIVVIDQASFDTLVDAGYQNVVNLPNPVSPQVSTFVEEHKNNFERTERTLLFAGHVVPTKGVYELVDACKKIPDVHLKMVGTLYPGIKEDLLQHAIINGDNSWLEICGELPYENVLAEMMKCEVFILPTYTEGFPNVILESMACGCPIVTTPVGAIPEMLDINGSDKCGICVPQRDVDKLRVAIQFMLDNKEFASLCGDNACKRVNELYSMDCVWNKLQNIWLGTQDN